MPDLYIIAGCNGAGKTTASMTILPEMLNCFEFVNADSIAKGISPFRPEKVAFEAGRIMLHRIDELIAQKVDFAFETTLSTKSYKSKVLKAQSEGYKVTLVFFWLPSPELAIQRVAKRVADGGHDIPQDVIIRRFERGISNLMNLYLEICDETLIMDGRSLDAGVIAHQLKNQKIFVRSSEKWNALKGFKR